MKRSYRIAVTVISMVLLSMPLLEGGGAAKPRSGAAHVSQPVASVPDWQNLPYLRQSNGWFRILSNHETFGGVEITNNTTITPNNPDPTSEEYSGINLEALWATRCQAVESQTMRMSRKVYLPGVPNTLQVSMWAYSSTGRHPLKSIMVKVNGSLVHQMLGPAIQTPVNRAVIELPRSAGSSFRYGLNTISLVAIKRETKRSAAYCSSKKFGAAFEVAGTFRADISSNIPHGQATDRAAHLPMTITNHGPSYLPAGTYPCQVPASGGGTQPGSCGYPVMAIGARSQNVTITNLAGLDAPPTAGGQVREDCRKFSDRVGDEVGYILNCPLPALAPGQSVTIHGALTYQQFQSADQIIKFEYRAPGYAETTQTNANNGESGRTITRDS